MRPSAAQLKPCPCGPGRRPARNLVCPACWRATPESLRECYSKAPTIAAGREAARRITGLAKDRNTQPSLF